MSSAEEAILEFIPPRLEPSAAGNDPARSGNERRSGGTAAPNPSERPGLRKLFQGAFWVLWSVTLFSEATKLEGPCEGSEDF
jgi:hypothetical protein